MRVNDLEKQIFPLVHSINTRIASDENGINAAKTYEWRREGLKELAGLHKARGSLPRGYEYVFDESEGIVVLNRHGQRYYPPVVGREIED